MSPDLDATGLGPDVIGVVDHPVRQPEQALFYGFEVICSHDTAFGS